MTTTQTKSETAPRLIETIEDAEQTSLEAVRKFVDTIDSAFPDLSRESDGPRRKIIDAAFKMTEQLVGASNGLAERVLDLTQNALHDTNRTATASKR